MRSLTITPRYTDYKSRVEAEQAFAAGKDFTVSDMSSQWDGKACNRQDLLDAGYDAARIRYRKLTQVTFVEIKQ